MVKQADAKRRAKNVVARLRKEFPDAHTALVYDTPLELLVATILSAQCTDARVNVVTKSLFRKYPTVAHYAKARQASLEREIRSTGFFRNKAKSIKGCCQKLVKDFDGEIPQDIEAMVALPGVGRKTANVVLGSAFGIASGVVVDTHVSRITQRLGLTREKDAVKIERDLMKHLPQKEWIQFSHLMIFHGRRTCMARKPKCDECCLEPLCPRVGVKK